jgi:hypothetical protein
MGRRRPPLCRLISRLCGASVAADEREGREVTPVLDADDVRKLVDRLPIPVPFDMTAMKDVVATLRGKPVVLAPYSTELVQQFSASGEQLPAAMCTSQPQRDYVLYRTDTTPTHQRHSILHELGHLALRHDHEQDLHRSFYADGHERAAEMFADLVERRIGTMRARPADTANPLHATTLDRYGSILEG